MTVYDLQLKLLEFQRGGLRFLKLSEQYPGIPVSSFSGCCMLQDPVPAPGLSC